MVAGDIVFSMDKKKGLKENFLNLDIQGCFSIQIRIYSIHKRDFT